MKEERVYILQKDLPDVKAGANLLWHEKKGKYILMASSKYSRLYDFQKEEVEGNTDWFKLKEEEVPNVEYIDLFSDGTVGIDISSVERKIIISSQRLAEILIAESKSLICITEEGYAWHREDEVIKKIEEAFNASRLINPMNRMKYESVSDYMNSIQ